MRMVKALYRTVVDDRARDAIWALRTRGDTAVASGVVRGVLGMHRRSGTTRQHLTATVGWLRAAQDACGGDGVSAFYDLREGTWGPPYPETTGYIIPTFYDVARVTGDDDLRVRAERMAAWLLGLQLESGAFPIGPLWPDWERRPIVFDTGQIVHGLVRSFEETGDASRLEAAARAGDWLAAIQEPDGSWKRFTSSGSVHTYNVRTAWALLRLHASTREDRHRRAAVANLAWARAQQQPDGWFSHMEFRAGEDPLTHTIAYTVEGVLESGVLLGDQALVRAATLAADALAQRQREEGYLGARYGSGWRRSATWSCLTGNAQMALVWFRLHAMTGAQEYLDAAVAANLHVKQRQARSSSNQGLLGGVSGSSPVYEGYEPYRNLNWAAKFFADSLLLEDQLHAAHQADAGPVRQ